eukprot:tig00000113_g5695.t1
MEGSADASPLLGCAGALRVAGLVHYWIERAGADHAEIASSSSKLAAMVSDLSAIEVLSLFVEPETLAALAERPLRRWARLHTLVLSCVRAADGGGEVGEAAGEIPNALLKRLASDVPSLEQLVLLSPLAPAPAAAAAAAAPLAALPRLRRLAFEGAAAAALDPAARAALRAALPRVQISADTSNLINPGPGS